MARACASRRSSACASPSSVSMRSVSAASASSMPAHGEADMQQHPVADAGLRRVVVIDDAADVDLPPHAADLDRREHRAPHRRSARSGPGCLGTWCRASYARSAARRRWQPARARGRRRWPAPCCGSARRSPRRGGGAAVCSNSTRVLEAAAGQRDGVEARMLGERRAPSRPRAIGKPLWNRAAITAARRVARLRSRAARATSAARIQHADPR